MPNVFERIHAMSQPSSSWAAPSTAMTQNMTPANPQPMPNQKPGGPMQGQQPSLGLFGSKPGGPPPQMQRPMPGAMFGSQFGARNMFNQPPQPGFPPPTGKPGLPPVNPSALPGMRPNIGPSVMPGPSPQALGNVALSSQAQLGPAAPGSSYTIGGRVGPSGFPLDRRLY